MEFRLGKVQIIKAIDDGGVSMYFRRERTSPEQSQRVVLSVEVRPPFPSSSSSSSSLTISNISRRNVRNTTKKATKKQQTATLRKFSPKCWVKSVVLISIKTMDNQYQEVSSSSPSNIPYPYPLDLHWIISLSLWLTDRPL